MKVRRRKKSKPLTSPFDERLRKMVQICHRAELQSFKVKVNDMAAVLKVIGQELQQLRKENVRLNSNQIVLEQLLVRVLRPEGDAGARVGCNDERAA